MSTIIPDIILNFNSDNKYWFEVNTYIIISAKLTSVLGDGNIEDGQPNFVISAAQALIRGLGVDFKISESGVYEIRFDPKFENNTKFQHMRKFFFQVTIFH
jgi:hypothetical protein